jgi:hypothetical protein
VFARIAAMKAQQAPQKTTPSYIDGYNAGMADANRMAQQEPAGEPVAHFGSAYVNENGVHITTVLGPAAIPQDAALYTRPAVQQEPAGEPVNVYCETCNGSGIVYQEHQAGCHVGGHYDCPDCDGKGYNIRHTHPAVPLTDDRCNYCDGTGDVHSITGEWRGSCVCEAGKQAAQPTEPAGEPVAWMPKTWTERYVSGVEAVTCYLRPTTGWVPLYTRPSVPLTDAQIDRAIAELGLNYLADTANNRAVLRELCRKAASNIGGA